MKVNLLRGISGHLFRMRLHTYCIFVNLRICVAYDEYAAFLNEFRNSHQQLSGRKQ